MGHYADINHPEQIGFGMGRDGAVIRQIIDTKVGGAVLDVSDYPKKAVMQGHIIIHNATTDVYKPMPIDEATESFGTLPSGFAYYGILISTIDTDHPFAGVMLRGTVNHKAMPFDVDSIFPALKAALPNILFLADN